MPDRTLTYKVDLNSASAAASARKATQAIEGEFRKIKTAPMGDMLGGLKGMDQAASSLAGGLGGLAGAAGVAGIAAVGAAAVSTAFDLARVAATAKDVETSFGVMARQGGAAPDKMFKGLQDASRGAINDMDLMLSANRAMLFGVADSTEEMVKLMDVARASSQAMGITTAEAFNDLVTGLGRGSSQILDNLGIIVKAEEANQAYAASIGKSVDELSEQEQKQALVNAVLRETAGLVEANEAAGDDAASNFERMDAAIDNAKVALGELFSPAIVAIANSLSAAVIQVTDSITTTSIEGAQSTLHDLGEELGRLAKEYERARLATSVALLHPETLASAEMQLTAVRTQLHAFALEYNKAAAVTGAPLLDLAAIDEGIIAFAEAEEGLDALGAAAEEAGYRLKGAAPAVDVLTQELEGLEAQSDRAASALASIASSAQGALHAAASAAVGTMPAAEIARIYGQGVSGINAQIKAMEDAGMGTYEIDFKMQEIADAASAPFDIAVESARESERAARDTESEWKRAASNVEEAFMDAAQELEDQLRDIPGLFGISDVTPEQMSLAAAGIPQNFADDIRRRLEDEVINKVDWADIDPAELFARAGIDAALPDEAKMAMFNQKWADMSLFADPKNLELFNQQAIQLAREQREMSGMGEQNILGMFGLGKDEEGQTVFKDLGGLIQKGMVDGAAEGMEQFAVDAIAKTMTQLKGENAIREYEDLGATHFDAMETGWLRQAGDSDIAGAFVAIIMAQINAMLEEQES